MMGWKLYEQGAMNADRFVEFVGSIIKDHHLENYLFLFDNAGAHKGEKIKKLMVQTNNRFPYECKLKNTSHIWQQLRVNKGETYGEHAKQGRRPRLCFPDICQQLGTNCKLIFEGTFSEKLCDVNEPYRHTAYGKGSILSSTSTTATTNDNKLSTRYANFS